jgi:hypothetical protein
VAFNAENPLSAQALPVGNINKNKHTKAQGAINKNSLFLTFPDCFGKVGKSDISIKTRKRTFYIFFGKR